MTLSGKIAIVTGAGRGIGKAIAERLAYEGATVVLAARTLSELEKLEASIGKEKAVAIPTDITKEDEVRRLFDEVRARYQRLDILVNNAGIGIFAPVRDFKISDLDALWNVNVRGAFLCTQQALPFMEKQRDGIIVNVSSLAGKNALKDGAAYAATKWALLGFGRSLMLEEREFNIRVVTISPGSVDTSFSPNQKGRGGGEKVLSPHDVAETVLAAVRMPPHAMMSEIDIRPTNPK
jgi:3-oxoacyl-[acyl-carrier protein] reductase